MQGKKQSRRATRKAKRDEEKRLAKEEKARLKELKKQDMAYVYTPPDPQKQVIEVGERKEPDDQLHIVYGTDIAACDAMYLYNTEYVDWIEARDREDICIACREEMCMVFQDDVKDLTTAVDAIAISPETESAISWFIDFDLLTEDPGPGSGSGPEPDTWHSKRKPGPTRTDLGWEQRRKDGKARGRPRPKGTR